MNKLISSCNRANSKKILMLQFTILRICHWAGMENLFLIGSINCMGWAFSTSAKYVEISVTGEEGHLKHIFNSGGTLMVWSAWKSQTLFISKMSRPSAMRLPSIRSCWENRSNPNLDLIYKRSLKIMKEIFWIGELTWIWRSKVLFSEYCLYLQNHYFTCLAYNF